MRMFSFLALGLLAAAFTLVPDMAFAAANSSASNVGEGGLQDIVGLVTGNIGTLIGLGIALLGLYTWLVQQSSWGIIMIIGGVAVTAFPGLFGSLQTGFASAFGGSGASDRKGADISGNG